LRFVADDAVRVALEAARSRFEETRKDVTFDGYIMEGLGRIDCRKAKVGPDSVMQAAFQVKL